MISTSLIFSPTQGVAKPDTQNSHSWHPHQATSSVLTRVPCSLNHMGYTHLVLSPGTSFIAVYYIVI